MSNGLRKVDYYVEGFLKIVDSSRIFGQSNNIKRFFNYTR